MPVNAGAIKCGSGHMFTGPKHFLVLTCVAWHKQVDMRCTPSTAADPASLTLFLYRGAQGVTLACQIAGRALTHQMASSHMTGDNQ